MVFLKTPEVGQLAIKADFFVDHYGFVERPYHRINEGGLLIVGKDSKGLEYRPKVGPISRGTYVLPSKYQYSVPVGSIEQDLPAIFFSYTLAHNFWMSEEVIDAYNDDEDFTGKFKLELFDGADLIPLEGNVERLFKKVTTECAAEFAESTANGNLVNHFQGVFNCRNNPELEEFLGKYRAIS